MPDFKIRVLETITQEKLYIVEAGSAEEARALAEGGDTVDEEFVRYVEVVDRKILGSPTLDQAPDPDPEEAEGDDFREVFGEPHLITGSGLNWFKIETERQAKVAGRVSQTAVEHYWRHAHGKLEGVRSHDWSSHNRAWLIALDDHDRVAVIMAALKVGQENAHPQFMADCHVTGFRNAVAFPVHESDIREACMTLNLVCTPNHMGGEIPTVDDDAPSP